MSDVLLVDDSEPGIRVLTLNRPERLNALDGDLVIRLLAAVEECRAATPELRVVVVKGSGRAFCAGADLKWLAEGTLADHAAHGVFQDNLNRLCNGLEALPQVVIGQLHGYALAGGLELALCCDLLTVADDTQLGDEHIRRNLIPGGGGSQRLPRKVGLARGLGMLLTGRRLTGAEAVDWGLAATSAAAGDLDGATMELARGMAATDGHALATMKRIVRRGLELPLADALWLELYEQQRYRAMSDAMDRGVSDFASHGS
ncbi:enoyl-CoA hydratase/isomerase family protein [Jiangella endophytica]|uniref:enoyl-CoA hydratase/isomerase family protein n=1 Tax=Jiangella endophytica TaxID=1623398 RepID=UPI000E34CEE9|nr:enoyl-CoA hydratase/isomerase family protein [Jiangella endophytica]